MVRFDDFELESFQSSFRSNLDIRGEILLSRVDELAKKLPLVESVGKQGEKARRTLVSNLLVCLSCALSFESDPVGIEPGFPCEAAELFRAEVVLSAEVEA